MNFIFINQPVRKHHMIIFRIVDGWGIYFFSDLKKNIRRLKLCPHLISLYG